MLFIGYYSSYWFNCLFQRQDTLFFDDSMRSDTLARFVCHWLAPHRHTMNRKRGGKRGLCVTAPIGCVTIDPCGTVIQQAKQPNPEPLYSAASGMRVCTWGAFIVMIIIIVIIMEIFISHVVLLLRLLLIPPPSL